MPLGKNDIRIFCDMDGVVYDWMGKAMDIFDVDPADPKNRDILKYDDDSLFELRDKTHVYDVIDQMGEQFWENLHLLPWGRTLYEGLKKRGKVVFLTSPGKWAAAAQGKVRAIRRDFDTSKILVGRSKEYCAHPNAILIDDKKSNIENFIEAGGTGFLWPNQYRIEDGDIEVEKVLESCFKEVEKLSHKIRERQKRYVPA